MLDKTGTKLKILLELELPRKIESLLISLPVAATQKWRGVTCPTPIVDDAREPIEQLSNG